MCNSQVGRGFALRERLTTLLLASRPMWRGQPYMYPVVRSSTASWRQRSGGAHRQCNPSEDAVVVKCECNSCRLIPYPQGFRQSDRDGLALPIPSSERPCERVRDRDQSRAGHL
jgi:hypothetical protein